MKPNELPQEIQDAARLLTEALLADAQAKAYHDALAALANNPEGAALEQRFMDLYTDLLNRQQKGETLSQQDVAPFYAMRDEYYAHPLIVARNDALGAFKPLLTEAAEQISVQIGFDFIELTRME